MCFDLFNDNQFRDIDNLDRLHSRVYSAGQAAFSSNLDAPDYLPAGSMRGEDLLPGLPCVFPRAVRRELRTC